jgi:hypothetical protein
MRREGVGGNEGDAEDERDNQEHRRRTTSRPLRSRGDLVGGYRLASLASSA